MNDKAEDYERIERFLRGKLNTSERAAFLAALDRDPGLRAEVELHRELENAFGDPEYEHLRQVLLATEEQAATTRRQGPLSLLSRRRWTAAAAAVLLLLASAIWFLGRPAPEPEALFAEYFTPYPVDAFRGEEADDATPQAIQAYQAGRYAEAAGQLESLPPAALSPQLRFYYGQALLGNSQGRKAAVVFEELVEEGALQGLSQPLSWYLALAYLQAGDLEKARTRLETIAADAGHYQQEKAREILKDW